MKRRRILLTGALGQIGTILAHRLIHDFGEDEIILSDISDSNTFKHIVHLDVTDNAKVRQVIGDHKITEVYHLAAILSARGEQNPRLSWNVNMDGFINIIDAAVEHKVDKVFFPSSIAVFGDGIDKWNCSQNDVQLPQTMYGITKSAGEKWSHYYSKKYKVDIRSLRYPGIIGPHSLPGGGTTDYAVHIFHDIIKNGHYECYLNDSTALPMMYMDDAIDATIQLMNADSNQILVRSSYNINGLTFTPKELFEEIKKHIPSATIKYNPDFRQLIADSWPSKINDKDAQVEWNWEAKFDLPLLVQDMLQSIK